MLVSLKKFLWSMPLISHAFSRMRHSVDLLISDHKNPQRDLPGHFYSPIPDFEQIKNDEARIFPPPRKNILGIDMNEKGQIELLQQLSSYYRELPFSPNQTPDLRYFFENSWYSYSDAIFLFCMIRHAKPQRIMEIGSGFSSALVLDTNEIFFKDSIRCFFIDPYPQRLMSLLKPEDLNKIQMISRRVQDVDLNLFSALSANDLLIVDSSHVAKVGSDVNQILFEILPRLRKGVYIHFHDIHFTFEYSKEAIYAGKSFNEAYLLRAFLQYNQEFQIVLSNSFLKEYHSDFFQKHMPLCSKNAGSLWINKLINS